MPAKAGPRRSHKNRAKKVQTKTLPTTGMTLIGVPRNAADFLHPPVNLPVAVLGHRGSKRNTQEPRVCFLDSAFPISRWRCLFAP
jgi:hypothetical protein